MAAAREHLAAPENAPSEIFKRRGSKARRPSRAIGIRLGAVAILALVIPVIVVWVGRGGIRSGEPEQTQPLDPAVEAFEASTMSAWDEQERTLDQRLSAASYRASVARLNRRARSDAAGGPRWRARLDPLAERTALLRSEAEVGLPVENLDGQDSDDSDHSRIESLIINSREEA